MQIEQMNLHPKKGCALVKRLPSNQVSDLILMPGNRIEKNLKCVILAITESKEGLQPGDHVLIWQGTGISLDKVDDSYLLVEESSMMAVVDEDLVVETGFRVPSPIVGIS